MAKIKCKYWETDKEKCEKHTVCSYSGWLTIGQTKKCSDFESSINESLECYFKENIGKIINEGQAHGLTLSKEEDAVLHEALMKLAYSEGNSATNEAAGNLFDKMVSVGCNRVYAAVYVEFLKEV